MYDKFILIVDDEQELLTLIKTIFERAGYTKIMTATSGEMALQIIRETLPDMVILDVMLPGMDGFEVLQEIRALKMCIRDRLYSFSSSLNSNIFTLSIYQSPYRIPNLSFHFTILSFLIIFYVIISSVHVIIPAHYYIRLSEF